MRKLYLPLAAIFALVAIVIWKWFRTDLSIGDSIVGYVGSFASAYSLLIAILEILALKGIAIATHEAAMQAKDAVFKIIEVDDMGKAVELLPYVKNAISNSDYGRAITTLEKLSTSYCEIYDVEDPDLQQREHFDVIHAIIDKLEIKQKSRKKLEDSEAEEMLAHLTVIQKELKIESKKRKRS